MSLLYPRGLSTHTSFKANKFYTTSFKPISNYSSGCSQFYQNNKSIVNSYMENYIKESKENNPENLNNFNYSKDIFRSRINRTKQSPFYNHEKSLRLQDEIEWINKLIHSKSNLNINKMIRINPHQLNYNYNILIKEEDGERDISENIINGMRIENLNKIIKINNRLKNRDVLINKRSMDNYNYKNFMYQMNKFKSNGMNKWKNDFNRIFNEY